METNREAILTKLGSDFWKQAMILLSASLIVITSLAWNDAFITWFARQQFFTDPVVEAFVYALLVTSFSILFLWTATTIRKRNMKKKKNS